LLRAPAWFLEKIAAGLAAAGIPAEASSPAHKMSRAEIEDDAERGAGAHADAAPREP